MSKLEDVNKKIEKTVVGTYKIIEKTAVGTYKTIENNVVSIYKKIEDRFINTFIVKNGETTKEAKEKLIKKQKKSK